MVRVLHNVQQCLFLSFFPTSVICFASLHWPFCAIIAGSKPPPPSFFYLAKAMPSCPPAEAADHQLFEINIALTCTAALVHTHTAAAVINYRHIHSQSVSQSERWTVVVYLHRKEKGVLSCPVFFLCVLAPQAFKQYHFKSDFWAQLGTIINYQTLPLTLTTTAVRLSKVRSRTVAVVWWFTAREWMKETNIIIK